MVKDIPAKEEKNEDKKKQKIPKEISQEILKKMFKSIVWAIAIMLYFIILNLAYSNIKHERLIKDIEVFSGAFLVVGIILLEMAYKKDNGTIAINGVECLFLSLHSLSILHVITLFKYDFRYYLLTSSYIFSIYYVLKAIILYTKGRREYLKSLSDISEIVKKEEPVIKEAKKRKVDEAKKEIVYNKKKNNAKNNSTEKLAKNKKNSKVKKQTVDKKKKSKEEVNILKEKETTKKKKETTKPKTDKSKTKQHEETKTPEKKKRGRPPKRGK